MSRTQPIAVSAPVAGPFVIAALLGATILAVSLTPAHAQSAATSQTQGRGETVEQRISTLHAQLKITPAEDSKWNSVAQAMRDNAAAMEKLVADKTAKGQQNMTAVDDMKTYESFTQAHLDGLKNLTSSFQTLYDAMPDPQKKVADQVFENFGRRGAAARG